MAKRARLVRYVSPLGSPAWMYREQAEGLLAEDRAHLAKLDHAGCLDKERDWPPRIEEYNDRTGERL